MSDRREEILTAARALAADRGLSGLSVRAVAAAAGIGASTLRHYFPSQRDLYDALVAESLDAQLDDLRIGDASLPPDERLVACLWQFLRLPEGQPAEAWLVTMAAMADPAAPPESRRVWGSLVRRGRDRVAQWLRVLETEGVLGSGDVERAARLLLTVVDGIALGLAMPDEGMSRDEADEVLRDAVATVLPMRR
jgi:AcrR family transcriptional regulator